MEATKIIFQLDPFQLNKTAEYSFMEFDPVKFQGILKNWVS